MPENIPGIPPMGFENERLGRAGVAVEIASLRIANSQRSGAKFSR